MPRARWLIGIPLLALMGGAPMADEFPVYQILQNADVFGMCHEPRTEEDIENLARMGIDVICRGISCAWHATPDQARDRMKGKAALAQLARERKIAFCTMITSAAMFPDIMTEQQYQQWAARDAKGQLIPAGSWHQGCLNVPGYREFVKQIARGAIDGGADGIHYDEAYSRWFWMHPIPCFCDACCRELQEHLKVNLPAAELRERFGIEDIDAFDYREYLEGKGLAEKPHESPLHDLWWLMQLDTTYRYEKEIVEDAKRYAREEYGRDILANSNQYQIAALSAAMTLETAVYDFVNIGAGWHLSYRDGGRWLGAHILPPQLSFVPQYKMARSHAGDKPVTMFLDIQQAPSFVSALPPEQQDNLMLWLCAEAEASGCHFALHHRFSNYDGPIESQIRYGRFFQRHRQYYRDTDQVAEIGVLYSYPSQIWDMYPLRWDRASKARAHSLQYWGVCEALQDANIQYEALFLGDGKLFPETPDALRRYPLLIAPDCFAATDGQLKALSEYVAQGGVLLRTGDLGRCDERRRQRDGLPSPLAEITALEADFEGFLSRRDPSARVELVRALVQEHGHLPLAAVGSPERDVQVHVRRTATGEFLIDLINRDFQEGRGFADQPALKVEVNLPPGAEVKTAQLLSPDVAGGDPQPLTVRAQGPRRVVIDVPGLQVYALIVLS